MSAPNQKPIKLNNVNQSFFIVSPLKNYCLLIFSPHSTRIPNAKFSVKQVSLAIPARFPLVGGYYIIFTGFANY
jgi:hypothetical protein